MSDNNPTQDKLPKDDAWEEHILAMGKRFEFPPTPDIATLIENRLHPPPKSMMRLITIPTALVLMIACIAVLALPDLRAIASDVLRIGGIQLIKEEHPRESVSPETANDYVDALREIAEPVSLDVIQGELDMDIPLPSFPDDVGPPDTAFLRRADPMMIILVWNDPVAADSIEFSLQFLPNTIDIRKYYDADPDFVVLRRTYGYWLTQPHLFTLRLSDGTDFFERWIEHDVLIWEENDITFRIESDLPLETVIQIAESLTDTP